MGKLIDSEILRKNVIKNLGLTNCLDTAIKETPAVPAIPIKWIQERIEEAASNDDTPYVKCLEWTLLIYRNEVEDGKAD